jgi:hypothetical protein
LPNEWLNFNTQTLTFSGTPTLAQILNIEVTATDIAGVSASDDFVLEVKGPNSVDGTSSVISVYPNPVTTALSISATERGFYKVYTIDGKQVMNGILSGSVTRLSTNTWANGVYIIEINTVSKSLKQQIVKQ